MTVIRPNSIAGITSLTALGTAIDFYNVNGTGIAFNNVNLNNTSGISTFNSINVTSIVGVSTIGVTTAYVTSINDGPISGSKNRIINGDFEIWQRGTSVTFLDGSTNFYLADRWSGTAEYQKARHQRVSIADTYSGMVTRYALRASSSTTAQAASGTRITLGQKIENVNMYDLRGKTVTASFWVKFSAATVSSSTATAYGNWSAYFGFPTSVDATFATTSPITGVGTLQLANGALPTTWTKYSITATVPSNAGNIDLRFLFANLGNTASADTVWYDITQVQLEEGPVASVFERRSFGQELALCQRYYYRLKAGSSYANAGVGRAYSTTNGQSIVSLPVSMRALPVGGYSALADWNASQSSGNITALAPVSQYSLDYKQMTIDITATMVSGQAVILNANNTTNAWIDWSAEL